MSVSALSQAAYLPALGPATPSQLANAILRNPIFMVIAADEEGHIIFFNAAAEKSLGYSAAEVIGQRMSEVWHDSEELRQYARDLSIQLGTPVEQGFHEFAKRIQLTGAEDREWTFIRKDGSRFPALSSIVPIKDEQGRMIGYAGISKDITQIRAQQHSITNHEIFLDAVIGHLVDGLITINDRGLVQNYNPACEELFGYKADEVIGKNVSMLMAEADRDKYFDYLEKHLILRAEKKSVSGLRCEVQGKRKDGSVFPFDLSVNEFEIDGQVMFCGTVHDISERKRALTERECLIEKLTDSNVEFERFAYVASHDMQEPLRTLNSFSELILTEYKNAVDDQGKIYLNLIRDAASRMQTMVTDLLEYARVGKGPTHSELFDARNEFEHALQNLLTSIAANNAKVTSDLLPQINGDPVQFLRLLQNLIGNGLKYHQHDIPATIHVAAKDQGESWLFSVADNGIGIDAKHLIRIFEPFKRLHSQQEYAGTGLGLTVCKRIVENHSGKIWCVSTPGQGSTFYFTWPKG
ncbi:MAG: PAS domain S-box protein [Alphaproteobacteria bacterium]